MGARPDPAGSTHAFVPIGVALTVTNAGVLDQRRAAQAREAAAKGPALGSTPANDGAGERAKLLESQGELLLSSASLVWPRWVVRSFSELQIREQCSSFPEHFAAATRRI